MVSAAGPGLSRASSPSPPQTFALPASESVADRSSPRASCIENGLGASVEIGVTGYGGEAVGARLGFPALGTGFRVTIVMFGLRSIEYCPVTFTFVCSLWSRSFRPKSIECLQLRAYCRWLGFAVISKGQCSS